MTDLKMGEFFTLGGTEEEGEKAFDPSATENTSRPYKTGRPCHIQCTELTEDNSPTHPHKKPSLSCWLQKDPLLPSHKGKKGKTRFISDLLG